MWRRETWVDETTFTNSYVINSIVFSPDEQTIYSGVNVGIKQWSLDTKEVIKTFRNPCQWFYSFAMSPDGQTLFSGGSNNTIEMWNASTGRKIRVLDGHYSHIYALAMSPDGQTLVSGGRKNIRIWRSI